MSTLPISEARSRMAEVSGRVEFGGERIELQKHGRTVAVLVSPSDAAALEALEERLDLLDALDALAEVKARTETFSHDEVFGQD